MTPFKPAGYNSASPYLVVPDARATLRFLEAVFGAVPLRIVQADDGRLRHAEAKLDDTVIMFADALPSWPAIACHVHVYVDDVDAVYARALAAGGEPVQAPIRKEDEDKRGGVRDGCGVTWWSATKVE